MRLIQLFGVGIVLVIFARLFQLQIIQHRDYLKFARRNYARPQVIKSPRGRILDRNGKVIASDVLSFDIYLPLDSDHSLFNFLQCDTIGNYIVVHRKPFELVAKLAEHSEDYRGVQIIVSPLRRYWLGEIFSHPLGYIAKIHKSELRGDYKLGDLIGKSGIEKNYESFLRGKDGYKYIVTDAYGRELGALEEYISPQPGKDIILTIDSDLQRYAYEILPKGAIVACDPKTGEILIYVSKPGYDPNSFVLGSKFVKSILTDTLHPLWDRVRNAQYPPGSVFKLAIAAIALEKKLITPERKFTCTGKFSIGKYKYRCWSVHHTVDLYNAIVQSCDIYFYKLGIILGVNNIHETVKLGFGSPTGIDLPNESKGFVPSKAFYNSKYGRRRWGKGIPAILAIGQGEILVTPLQLLRFIAALANYGVTYTPHLVRYIQDKEGRPIGAPRVKEFKLPLSEETISFIRRAMRGVVNDENGTGRLAKLPDIIVCGKTGTAENPHGKDHAWFVCFAPYDDPKIALVVFVENGGMGGGVAAPIARKILKRFFEKYPVQMDRADRIN